MRFMSYVYISLQIYLFTYKSFIYISFINKYKLYIYLYLQDINLSIYISKERSLVKCSRKYTRATHITGSTGILLRRFFANNERKDSPTSYIATNIMVSFHFLLSNNVTGN